MNTGLRVILGYKLLQNYGYPEDEKGKDVAAGGKVNSNLIKSLDECKPFLL